MSRNRSELLLRILHFCDNENQNVNNRLYKIRVIINMLNENFQKYYDPALRNAKLFVWIISDSLSRLHHSQTIYKAKSTQTGHTNI